MKSILSIYLTLSILTGVAARAAADFDKPRPMLQDFEKSYDVKSVGRVRVSYKVTGEPVSRPARVEIWVKCKGSSKETLVERVPMCHLTKYSFEEDIRLITLSFIYGRVDEASHAKCDGKDEREFPLSRICAQNNQKK